MVYVGVGSKKRPRSGLRTKNSVNRPQPTIPISIVSAVKGTTIITLTFNQPVALKGVPKYTTNLAAITALSATHPDPMTVAITFSASIAAATTLNIPYEDLAIRNQSGGFVSDSTFPVS